MHSSQVWLRATILHSADIEYFCHSRKFYWTVVIFSKQLLHIWVSLQTLDDLKLVLIFDRWYGVMEKNFFFIQKMCFYLLAPPLPNHMTLGKSLWFLHLFGSVQSLSRVWLFVTPWTAAHQASLSITNFRSLLKLMSTVSVMPSNHLILCRPLLPCLQSFPASGSFPMSQLFTSGGQSIGVSASESVLPMNSQDWFPLGWTG